MAFTNEQLDILAHGLDMIVRTEGQAMAQHGIAGIKAERVLMLSRNLKLAVAARAQIDIEKTAMAEAAKQAEEVARAAAAAQEPVAEGG